MHAGASPPDLDEVQWMQQQARRRTSREPGHHLDGHVRPRSRRAGQLQPAQAAVWLTARMYRGHDGRLSGGGGWEANQSLTMHCWRRPAQAIADHKTSLSPWHHASTLAGFVQIGVTRAMRISVGACLGLRGTAATHPRRRACAIAGGRHSPVVSHTWCVSPAAG